MVAGLGIDTVETVLLYHVPGSKINAKAALKANGASLTTAQSGQIRITVKKKGPQIILGDNDPNSRCTGRPSSDGHQQGLEEQTVAHGIDRSFAPLIYRPWPTRQW